MTVSQLKSALDSTLYPFAHYAWSHAPSGDYGVYGEDMAEELSSDNVSAETMTEVTVDLFTRNDDGSPRNSVENAIRTAGGRSHLDSIQYEDDTGYIHYSWLVMCCG